MPDKSSRRILCVLSAILFSVALLSGASQLLSAKAAPKRITILYTNDTLGTIEPCG